MNNSEDDCVCGVITATFSRKISSAREFYTVVSINDGQNQLLTGCIPGYNVNSEPWVILCVISNKKCSC
jgi:hypothetical protein